MFVFEIFLVHAVIEICKLHARHLLWHLKGKRKKSNHFPFPRGCCVFVCSSVWRPSYCLHRRSAVSWLALLLQRLSQLPVGDWSSARPRSQDPLWQVCVWRSIATTARTTINNNQDLKYSSYLNQNLNGSLTWLFASSFFSSFLRDFDTFQPSDMIFNWLFMVFCVHLSAGFRLRSTMTP